jgi:hypothetical protein
MLVRGHAFGLSSCQPCNPGTVRASPLFRITALWALLVFTFGWGGDALVLHPCPHHSAISHAGMAAHAGHGGGHHAAAAPEHPDGHDAPSHAGGCSCIVACAGMADALAASAADVRPAAIASRVVREVAATHTAALPGRIEYVLPYPTAPPALS